MATNLITSNISDRALREKAQLDGAGLNRRFYSKVFSHTKHYYRLRRDEILLEQLQYADGRRVLEIGSQCWVHWTEDLHIRPDRLNCINISSRALEKGEEQAKTCSVKPEFSLMDANNLQFADNSFDMVFGDAILHHLDFTRALDEIKRVLRPNGRILFTEPLGINPIGKIVRLLTPQARTKDEQPLRIRELAELRKRFETTFYYEQFLSVPIGVMSRMLFSSPANNLTKAAYKIDRFIDANFPPLRNLYRDVIIAGTSKS
jgi:ubiquinone/menaquinone biosynthesis C-methylase UbiE